MTNLKNMNQLSRELFMKATAAACLGVTSSFNSTSYAESNTSPKRKKIVRVFTYGGMSHLDSFDPKPNSPQVMGDTKVIPTSNDDQISHFFPKIAKSLDKMTLIRGMSSSEADHSRAQYLMQTSYPRLGTVLHPSLGAWYQKLNGKGNDDLPASVGIQSKHNYSGYLGSEFNVFSVGNPKEPLRGLIDENVKSDGYQKYLKYVTLLNKGFHSEYGKFRDLEAYRNLHNSSMKFMHSKELEAFDLNKASKEDLKKYNIPFGSSFLLAKQLLKANVQYITLGLGNWDHHYYIWDGKFAKQANELDTAFTVFMEDLIQEGLWDNTILALNNEFGRTPSIGSELGRSHYNKAFSSIICGAGVKKGYIHGKTDETASKVIEGKVTPQDFNATLAKLVGLDLEKEIYSPDNRPFTVSRGGKVIDELLI